MKLGLIIIFFLSSFYANADVNCVKPVYVKAIGEALDSIPLPNMKLFKFYVVSHTWNGNTAEVRVNADFTSNNELAVEYTIAVKTLEQNNSCLAGTATILEAVDQD